MEEFGIVVFEVTTYVKKNGRHWCAKENLKTLLIDMLWLGKDLSRVCLRWGGTIECTVTGCRKYSADKADLKFPALYFSR